MSTTPNQKPTPKTEVSPLPDEDLLKILNALQLESGITEHLPDVPTFPNGLQPLSGRTVRTKSRSRQKSNSKNLDGSVAVKNGQLIFTWPEGKGSFPIIKPMPGVEVYINNTKIEGERVILPQYQVTVVPKDFPPVSSLNVQFSDDEIEAYADFHLKDGSKCALADSDAQVKLALKTVEKERIPATKPTLEEMKALLKEKEVVFGIIETALADLVEHPNSGFRLVARGNPAINPEDAELQPLFSDSGAMDEEDDSSRLDYYERDEYLSVKAGALIAQKRPPVPGTNGLTVTGKTIEVPSPKDFSMQAGPGVNITEDGLFAVATAGGRPVIEGYRISIINQRIVPGDVNIQTGNVHFTGDILVQGVVCDNTTVTAEGSVEIRGNVEEAKIIAQGDVWVHGNIIASSVEAGAVNANEAILVACLSQLHGQLQQALNAFNLLLTSPGYQEVQKKGISSSYALRLVIENKAPSAAKTVNQIKLALSEIPPENRDFYTDVVDTAYDLFCRGRLMTLESPEIIETYLNKLGQVIAFGEARKQLAGNAVLKVSYVQNSSLNSHGSIIVKGKGCYNSDLYAFKDVTFQNEGIFRGGKITCENGKVMLYEVGGPSGAETVVSILEKGEITAKLAHPNVVFSIGHQALRLNETVRLAEIRLTPEGRLDLISLKGNAEN